MKEFLGKHISEILEKPPFNKWSVERSIEDGLLDRKIEYIFEENGLEIHCDEDDEINIIFLFSEEYEGFKEELFELSLSKTSLQVRDYYGNPSKSGEKCTNSFFGDMGAWDRFDKEGYSLHFEYSFDSENINKVTLMSSSVVPD